MYLLHIPLKWVLLAKAGVSEKDTAVISGLTLLGLTVVVAMAMTYFVDRPLEAFRQRRFEQGAREAGSYRTTGSSTVQAGAG
jgi:peptidoglycan/LPS O-acetylase OafA/YrhL